MSDRAEIGGSKDLRLFRLLLIAFTVQVLGRLLDFRWHATHEEFETGGDQIQAHWLVWLGTIIALAVGIVALRSVRSPNERRGYWTVVAGNSLYVPVAVLHFIQHLNREEVDWTHVALALTNVVALSGVVTVVVAWFARRRQSLA